MHGCLTCKHASVLSYGPPANVYSLLAMWLSQQSLDFREPVSPLEQSLVNSMQCACTTRGSTKKWSFMFWVLFYKEASCTRMHPEEPKLPYTRILHPRIGIVRICPGHRVHIVVAICTARGGLMNVNFEGLTLASACVNIDRQTCSPSCSFLISSLNRFHLRTSNHHLDIC